MIGETKELFLLLRTKDNAILHGSWMWLTPWKVLLPLKLENWSVCHHNKLLIAKNNILDAKEDGWTMPGDMLRNMDWNWLQTIQILAFRANVTMTQVKLKYI